MTWKNAEADYHNADSTIVNEWSAIEKLTSGLPIICQTAGSGLLCQSSPLPRRLDDAGLTAPQLIISQL